MVRNRSKSGSCDGIGHVAHPSSNYVRWQYLPRPRTSKKAMVGCREAVHDDDEAAIRLST